MAEQRPTDEFCKPHEYIVERNRTWFIVDVHNRVRVHPEEYPEELRYTAPKPSKLNWTKIGLAWLAGAIVTSFIWAESGDYHPMAAFLYISILAPIFGLFALLPIGLWAELHPDPRPEQRKAWEAATYRDAGFYQPILHTWDGTGGMSSGISSPDATWGV